MSFLRLLSAACLAVSVVCPIGIPEAFAEDTANKITKIQVRELELYDPESQDHVKTVKRVELDGKQIDILSLIDGGDAFKVDIPGIGVYMVFAEDVITDLDAAFFEKCRAQMAQSFGSGTGAGRSAGTGCN